ncbi:MAG: phospholipid carrier-dependent glycosyltransferase [bacterium]
MSTSSWFNDFIHRRTSGFILALALITLLGAGLRLAKLGDYPGGFGQDEAVNLYDAWSLLTTGTEHHGAHWPLNSGQFGDYPSALQAYLTIPFVALLGPTELAARLPCALLNIAAIPLFGWLLCRLFRSRATGLFGAALLASSPWNIFFSRWAVSPGFVTFFQVAGMLLMIRLLAPSSETRRRYGAAILTGFMLFMWTHQYLSQYFFAPLMIGLGLLLWSRRNWLRVLITGGSYSLFMLLAILPRMVNPSTAGRFSKESVFYTGHGWTSFWQNYWEYLSFPFLFTSPKMLPLHQIPDVPHIQHFLIPFYLLGIIALIGAIVAPHRLLSVLNRPHSPAEAAHWRRVSLWMLGGLLLAPLAGALFIQHMYTSRMTHLLLQVILVTSLGCAAAWHLLRRLPVKALAPILAALLVFGLCQSSVKTMKGLARNNLFLQGWLQQGVPDVMRFLNKQKNVQSVNFPRMMQGYIYHLAFSPVHPSSLDHAEVALPLPDLSRTWNYANIETVGKYHFFPDLNPAEIEKTCALRHQVCDKHGIIWYNLYEKNGVWTVLKNKDLE